MLPGRGSSGTRSRHPPSFNPHPARGPGAAPSCRGPSCRRSSFNPHPARGPGAAGEIPGRRATALDPVSILTRPGGRVLQATPTASPSTRPCGFNPHPARGPGAARVLEGAGTLFHPFQSSPGPGAGCCRPESQLVQLGVTSFNPHPARGPGAANREHVGLDSGVDVSILTRPGGRVLHTEVRVVMRQQLVSDPHPARGPGAAGDASLV